MNILRIVEIRINFRSLAPVIQVGRDECYYYFLIKPIRTQFSYQKVMWNTIKCINKSIGIAAKIPFSPHIFSIFFQLLELELVVHHGLLENHIDILRIYYWSIHSSDVQKSFLDFGYAWEYTYRSAVTFASLFIFVMYSSY